MMICRIISRSLLLSAIVSAIAIPALSDARNSAKFLQPSKVRMIQYPPDCGPVDEVRRVLSRKYQERPEFQEMERRGAIFEIWEGLATWSATTTTPTGIMCVHASGPMKPDTAS